MAREIGRLRASSRVEHHVRVEHAAYLARPWAYAVVSSTGAQQAGSCDTREAAYACALSTLRGMIALERIRQLAR